MDEMLTRGQRRRSVDGALLALLGGACAAGGSDGGGAETSEPPPATQHEEPPREHPPHEGPRVPAELTPLFGVEPAPVAPEQAARCQKVDLLYVVDNSASMTDEQASLARSFAGFSRVVTETLGGVDLQIMVVDTDSWNVGDTLNARQRSGPADTCDGMLGAGQRMDAEGESCGIRSGRRFLRGDERDAADAFGCLAHVGTLGDASERPIDALLAATGASASAAGTCNLGFLRDDAVLVVTLITDEEDEVSMGGPAEWKRELLGVKGGDEDAVVLLGLIGDLQVPGGLPGGPCDELGAAPAPRLQRFVESFALGSLGSVCADDYSEFFEQAVGAIDTACEAFEPVLH
jgi:hypothetical protein